jgi:polar amino acid transport system substrate-binding protein
MPSIMNFMFNFNWLTMGCCRFRAYGLTLSVALLSFDASGIANNDYTIAVNDAYSFDQGAETIQTLFDKVYAPLGIKPRVVFYPSLRGLRLVNNGTLDAESGRTAEIGAQYPNLIQVSYPVMTHHNGYFCLRLQACKISKDTLIAVVPGFEAGKRYCQKNGLNCLFDQSHGVIARALERGTIEVLIASHNTATKIVCLLNNQHVYYKNVDALSVTSYHFIHKKHQDLEPALAVSIRELAESGEFDRLLQDTSLLLETCSVDLIKLE